ncbi:MAG: sensor histidine kinase [Halanaerobiales bacterium]
MYLTKIKKMESKVSKNEQEELRLLKEQQNFTRCRQISYVSFMLIFFTLVTYYFFYRKLWTDISGYRYLFYAHLSYLLGVAIYYSFLYMLKYIEKKKIFKNIIYYYFIILTLIFCISMSIIAELIHDHIYAYIIAIFAIAYFVVFTTLESLTILGGSFIVFVLGSYLYNGNTTEVLSFTMNSFIGVVLAYCVSRINYMSFLKDFLNKKKLIKKNYLLKEQNKHKSILLGNTSHELKTPLNLIYSAEQMLDLSIKKSIEDEAIKSKLGKYLTIIKQNSFRLMRLINNIVDATRMDIGEYKINIQNVEVVSIINQIVRSVISYVEEKGIEISFTTELNEKVIACDPDSIERILLNLISNAVKYTPVNGHIDVTVYMEGCYLLISVKDTGAGIPEEIQESIFERYVQAEDMLTKTSGGSGIGLSLVKYLVSKHKGIIKLNSTPGQGSEFIIKLPDRVIEDDQESTIDNEVYKINDQMIEKIKLEFSDIYKI